MFNWLSNFGKKPKKNLSGKKIISFSLWGNDPKYIKGAIANIALQQKYYPGWTNRYYVDNTVPEAVISELTYSNCEIIRKETSRGHTGLFWRFEPGFDQTIERFIVRDCDSRLNAREAAAVNEWTQSDFPFHIMRDHQFHTSQILGGMWGAIPFFISDFKKLFDKWTHHLQPSNHRRGLFFDTDQTFLNRTIWPRIRKKHLAHSSSIKITMKERMFTVDLPEGQFIGQQFDENNNPILI